MPAYGVFGIKLCSRNAVGTAGGKMYVDTDGNVHPWHFVFTIIGILLAFWVLSIGIWGFGVATAGIYGRGEAHKQLNSAEFRITSYNHFFEACSSIQGLEGSIDELTTQLDATTSERDRGIVLSSLTGTKAARHQAIADYNADARKNYTEGQFRDNDLPFHINDSKYPDEAGKTSCGAD